jgi:hypothetical protein
VSTHTVARRLCAGQGESDSGNCHACKLHSPQAQRRA